MAAENKKTVFSSDMLKTLWDEVNAAGLIPDDDTCKSGHADLMTLGFIERNYIVSCIGESVWRTVLTAYNRIYPEGYCIHILGVGYVLTDYFVRPLGLPESERVEIARLGAVTYLIASVHDVYFDQGAKRRYMLPRWLLKKMILRQIPVILSLFKAVGPEKLKMSISLLSIFFSQLDQLKYSTRHRFVYDDIHRAILRMYEAECESVSSVRSKCNTLYKMRKSVLQVVVMGLPGWLALPEFNRIDFRWHLKWLYRFGAFFRWIDDIIDIDEDRANGIPNLYLLEKHRTNISADFDKKMAEKIVSRGKTILEEWERKCADTGDIPDVTRNIFGICLVSSIGFIPGYDITTGSYK